MVKLLSLERSFWNKTFFRFAEKPLLKMLTRFAPQKTILFLWLNFLFKKVWWNKTFFRFAEKPLLKMLTQKLLRKSFIKNAYALVSLVKLSFLKERLLQRSLRKQGLKRYCVVVSIYMYNPIVAGESKKTRTETIRNPLRGFRYLPRL